MTENEDDKKPVKVDREVHAELMDIKNELWAKHRKYQALGDPIERAWRLYRKEVMNVSSKEEPRHAKETAALHAILDHASDDAKQIIRSMLKEWMGKLRSAGANVKPRTG